MQSTLRHLAFATLVSCVVGAELDAGTITGTIRARGPTDSEVESSGGTYGSRRYKFLDRIDYDALTDFFVYIDQPVTETTPTPPARAAMIRQRDGTFEPHVIAVPVGTTVQFPNEDDIYHNVFSLSDSTPFDLGLYKRGEAARQVRFDQTGRVDVFCSIHTKMSCIVLVVPNRFVARADDRGRWSITGVPAGTYRLKGWHERMPARVSEITVPAEGQVSTDFVLGFGEPPPS